METLLTKVRQNLILEHEADDPLLQSYIVAAISYAERYQHLPEGHYQNNAMPATTEQAIIMLVLLTLITLYLKRTTILHCQQTLALMMP